MKSDVEETVVLAAFSKIKEVANLQHGRFWVSGTMIHHVYTYGQPPTVGTNLDRCDAITIY